MKIKIEIGGFANNNRYKPHLNRLKEKRNSYLLISKAVPQC